VLNEVMAAEYLPVFNSSSAESIVTWCAETQASRQKKDSNPTAKRAVMFRKPKDCFEF
jgi:hypothetical protein